MHVPDGEAKHSDNTRAAARTLQRELGSHPTRRRRLLANEIARSGAAESLMRRAVRSTRGFAALRPLPDRSPQGLAPAAGDDDLRNGEATLALASYRSIAVADCAGAQFDRRSRPAILVDAFTDDLVTDLLRHGRGLSLKPLVDERAAAGKKLPRAPEPVRGYDYIVTGSAQHGNPGTLRVNMRISVPPPPGICGRASMSSGPKTSHRSRPVSPGGFPASFTTCCYKRQAGAPLPTLAWNSG